jgi:hypothetical protein
MQSWQETFLLIRSKDLAAMYTEEQREGICKWCRKHDYDKCTACALLSVPAYNPEEVKSNDDIR